MKLLPLLFLFFFASCHPRGFESSKYKYPNQNPSTDCQDRFDMELFEMSKKQEICFETEYETKTFLNKITHSQIFYNCPVNSFYNQNTLDKVISECEDHLRNPKFRIGQKVSLSESYLFDKECFGRVVRPSYSNTKIAIPTYIIEVVCEEKIVKDRLTVSENEIRIVKR